VGAYHMPAWKVGISDSHPGQGGVSMAEVPATGKERSTKKGTKATWEAKASG
jgi:hypothetical protein